MAELVATKSTWTLFNPRCSPIAIQSMPVALGLLGSLSQRSFIFMSSRVLSPHYKRPHHFSATRDNKVNDCGFKFSVVCEWRVLFKEDKDDSLQFAKVFPTKFLKLPIRQSFPLPPFCTIRYKFHQ